MKKAITVLSLLIIAISSYSQHNNPAAVRPSIGGITSGMISKEQIITAGGLMISDSSYVVIHFEMTYHSRGDLVSRASSDDRFSESMIAGINELKPGQKVYFNNIKVRNSSGKTLILEALAFKIK